MFPTATRNKEEPSVKRTFEHCLPWPNFSRIRNGNPFPTIYLRIRAAPLDITACLTTASTSDTSPLS